MDYEKKYKEALEKARKRVATEPQDHTDAILKDIFPELREIEDERIRKELKEAFEAYDIESKWNGIPIRSIFAWLEKQKENPKSSDSIPSDCTSDAKCEDRWHKVKDSLPNSTREVLCKDAIGNFFIGRYYKSTQSWEVVMYDDCDKSNEDNPPVVKWCEIPSERQKEQKLAHTAKEMWKEMRFEVYAQASGNRHEPNCSDNSTKMFSLYDIDEIFEKIGNTAVGSQPTEWSEEDEAMRDNILRLLSCFVGTLECDSNPSLSTSYPAYQREMDWLKSLRPSWKPSEEQMKVFDGLYHNYILDKNDYKVLESLYEQLKKL